MLWGQLWVFFTLSNRLIALFVSSSASCISHKAQGMSPKQSNAIAKPPQVFCKTKSKILPTGEESLKGFYHLSLISHTFILILSVEKAQILQSIPNFWFILQEVKISVHNCIWNPNGLLSHPLFTMVSFSAMNQKGKQ